MLREIHSAYVDVGEVAELALAGEARLREGSMVAAQEGEVSERSSGSIEGGGGGFGRGGWGIGALPERHCWKKTWSSCNAIEFKWRKMKINPNPNPNPRLGALDEGENETPTLNVMVGIRP